MKTFKENKGFTLIELLAVIVVLAIVTVIATRSILPYMANAGRDTFVTEANLAIGGASDAMSIISLGQAPAGSYTTGKDASNNVLYCFTLDNLNTIGSWAKDDDSYAGRVVVTVPASGGGYSYAVRMHNDDYYVESAEGTVKEDNAAKYDKDNAHKDKVFDCSDVK